MPVLLRLKSVALLSCRNIRFSLLLGGQDLNYGLNSFEEGLEVAFRNMNSSNREWIPLKFYTANNSRNNAISVGNIDSDSGQLQVNIRGFDVPYVIGLNDATRAHEANLTICGSEVAQRGETFNHIQFRWLQTVQQGKGPDRDRILLDNVTITSSVYSTKLHKVLVDDFDNQTRIK